MASAGSVIRIPCCFRTVQSNGKIRATIRMRLKSTIRTKVLNESDQKELFSGDPHPTPLYRFFWSPKLAA